MARLPMSSWSLVWGELFGPRQQRWTECWTGLLVYPHIVVILLSTFARVGDGHLLQPTYYGCLLCQVLVWLLAVAKPFMLDEPLSPFLLLWQDPFVLLTFSQVSVGSILCQPGVCNLLCCIWLCLCQHPIVRPF